MRPVGLTWEHRLSAMEGKRLLLVGEGNFSFAAALLEHLCTTGCDPRSFVATAYSSALDLGQGVVKESVEKIRRNGGDKTIQIQTILLLILATFLVHWKA
jgi:hypothetical protein